MAEWERRLRWAEGVQEVTSRMPDLVWVSLPGDQPRFSLISELVLLLMCSLIGEEQPLLLLQVLSCFSSAS